MSEQNLTNDTRISLWIQQQNVNKSLISQLDTLQSLKCNNYHLCTLQEPYIDHNGKSQANKLWNTIYPSSTHDKNPDATRAILLINTNLLSDTWKQIPFHHPDITVVEIKGLHSVLSIINIYNSCDNNDTLPHIAQYMKTQLINRSPGINTHFIWVSDFNCHHPLWDKPRNNHLFTKANLEFAQLLLNLLGRFNMKMALPQLIPTLCAHSTANHMRVDNIFCDKILYEARTIRNTDEESRPIKSDHFPIVTQIDFLTVKALTDPGTTSEILNGQTSTKPSAITSMTSRLPVLSPVSPPLTIDLKKLTKQCKTRLTNMSKSQCHAPTQKDGGQRTWLNKRRQPVDLVPVWNAKDRTQAMMFMRHTVSCRTNMQRQCIRQRQTTGWNG